MPLGGQGEEFSCRRMHAMSEVAIDGAKEATEAGLREFELTPAARVVGPGRLERAYLQKIDSLCADVDAARERERTLAESLGVERSALEVSQRIERGCQRRIDRLEHRLEERTRELLQAERAQKRLALALGSVQREVELLRSQSALLLAEAPKTRPTSLWRRIFPSRG